MRHSNYWVDLREEMGKANKTVEEVVGQKNVLVTELNCCHYCYSLKMDSLTLEKYLGINYKLMFEPD